MSATSGRTPRPRGLFHHRAFRLVWIGESTSAVGNAVTAFALPLVAVTTLHASTLAVGLLYAFEWLPWLILGLPAGALIDRWNPRTTMIACDVGSLAVLATVPISGWLGVLSLTQVLVVAVAAGISSVFFTTSYSLLLPRIVAPTDLVEGNTKLLMSRSAAKVAGPGLAGSLAQVAGAVAGVALDAVTFAISALCLLRVQPRPAPDKQRPERQSVTTEISQGICLVAADPYLRLFAVFGCLANLFLTGWQALEILFLIRVLHVSAGVAGAVLAAIAIGGVTGAAATPRLTRRFGTARALRLGLVTTTPLGLLVPLAHRGVGVALVIIGGLIVSGGIAMSNVIMRSFRQRYCPPALLGRVTATMGTLGYSAIPAGALLAGSLGTFIGTRSALWVMTGGLVLSTAVLFGRPGGGKVQLPEHQRTLTARPPDLLTDC